MKQYLLLVMCCLAFSAIGACSVDTRGKDWSSRTIELQKKLPEKFFYYRTDHYAIIVEPETLVRRLEEQAARGGSLSDGRLLQDIRGNTLEDQSKDLFEFVLKDPLYFMRIELLLADVLQNGEASVVDAFELPGDHGRFLSATVLTKIQKPSYEGREFCTPAGDLLLKITDSVD